MTEVATIGFRASVPDVFVRFLSFSTMKMMRVMLMFIMPSDFIVVVVRTDSGAMQGLLHDLIQLPAKTPSDVGYLWQQGLGLWWPVARRLEFSGVWGLGL